MHTKIDRQVMGRFFTAINTLIELGEIDSLESYCTNNDFDFNTIFLLQNTSSNKTFHFDWLMPLIVDYGVSSLWILTGLGDMFMPMYKPNEK